MAYNRVVWDSITNSPSPHSQECWLMDKENRPDFATIASQLSKDITIHIESGMRNVSLDNVLVRHYRGVGSN